MNEINLEEKKVQRKHQIDASNLLQLCFYDENITNEKISPSLKASDLKVNVRRDKTFIKYAPEKENCAPLIADESVSRLKSNQIVDSNKIVRKNKTSENSLYRPQSASNRGNLLFGKPQQDNRTRSTSPASSKPTTPSSTNSQIKKLGSYHLKILDQLESVKTAMYTKPEEPFSLNEINRQRKRANEFAVRFSRNHLYQLRRLVNEIKKIIVPYPFDTLTGSDCENLSRKIYLAYQSASQALQTYINYVAIAHSQDIPEKVKELIFLIRDLYLCCEHLSISPIDNSGQENQGDILKKCKDLVNILDVKISENEERVKKKKRENDLSTNENRNPSERYSMYKVKLTNSNWKKKTESLAKIKFGSPTTLGRKRTKRKDDKKARITCDIYTQKMHPKCGKYFGNKFVKFDPMKLSENTKNQVNSEKKNFARKSRYNTPREVTSQDDDIETVVQNVMEDDCSTVRTEHSSSETKTSNHSDASPHLEKSELRQVLLEAINNLETKDKEKQNASLKKLFKSIRGNIKSPSENQSNVKVFHVKSKDMISETIEPQVDITKLHEEQKTKESYLHQERRLRAVFQSHNSTRQSNALHEESKPRGKIKLNLSDCMTQNVLKYKKIFKDFCKNNIMYQKNNAKKPWELVARISDHLVEEILKEIAASFQNDAILRRLYLNELLDAI